MSMILDVEWAERLGTVLTDARLEAELRRRDGRPAGVCEWVAEPSGRLACRWFLPPDQGPGGTRADFAPGAFQCMVGARMNQHHTDT